MCIQNRNIRISETHKNRDGNLFTGDDFYKRVLDPNLSNQRGFFSNRQHLASQPLLLFRVFYLGTSIAPFFRPSTSKSVKKNNYGSPAWLNSRSEAIHPQIKPWLSKRTCFFPLLACLCYEELSNKIKNSIYSWPALLAKRPRWDRSILNQIRQTFRVGYHIIFATGKLSLLNFVSM